MKLAISIKGGVLQSIEADEPVGFVVYFYDDQLADVIGPGRPIFKSVEGNDCAIVICAAGWTPESREYAAKLFDHAIKQVEGAQ